MASFTAVWLGCLASLHPTAETMGGQVVDLSSAMNALVWSAKRGAKSEVNSHPGNLIHPQSQAWHRQGL